MRIQRLIAIWAAKLCSTACRLAGKQGVTLAGKLARKIDPDIFAGTLFGGAGKDFCSLWHKRKDDDK